MNKSQKIKNATQKARISNHKTVLKKIISWPLRACESVWNWLKRIDIVGMVNLTLLVAIIVLFSSLINNLVYCKKDYVPESIQKNITTNSVPRASNVDSRRVVQRRINTTLPMKTDSETNIRPKIKTIGLKKPRIVRELSLPAHELPKQKLYGDVIIDVAPSSPILSNGVKINGNLFIQNVRKYTLPCDAKINGHLFVRNVDKLVFCGAFTVNGNIYVNRQSSFGPIPQTARIRGQIIL